MGMVMDMKGKGILALLAILIVLASAIPVYALGSERGNGGQNQTAPASSASNASMNATGLERAAQNLLKIVDRLANYTASMISNAAPNNETMALYTKAEELREEAHSEFQAGNYSASLKFSIMAMRDYRMVLASLLRSQTKEINRTMLMAKLEALRMSGYFKHVEMIIKAAEAKGLNVTQVEVLYNETREAYRKVLQDVMNNNSTALVEDLRTARTLRHELDMALTTLGRKYVHVNAGKIAMAFDKVITVQIKILQMMKYLPNVNASLIDNVTSQLLQLRENVTKLVREGKYFEALQLIKSSLLKLRSVAMQLHWIRKGHWIKFPVRGPGRPHNWGHGQGHGQGGGRH
ncbi:hypothetical protein [Thermococcus sp.]